MAPLSAECEEDYLLYPARRWPHKNHKLLFEAFKQLRRDRPELRLVLTGGGHTHDVPPGVEVRGLVPLDELVDLYCRAAALVFPSSYEGFGQPPLEAMATQSSRPCATCSTTQRRGRSEVLLRQRASPGTRRRAVTTRSTAN